LLAVGFHPQPPGSPPDGRRLRGYAANTLCTQMKLCCVSEMIIALGYCDGVCVHGVAVYYIVCYGRIPSRIVTVFMSVGIWLSEFSKIEYPYYESTVIYGGGVDTEF